MTVLPLATALVLGFGHALEPDHMAAVTTFVARRPRPAEAVRFGADWGVGHSAAILLAGGVLIVLDLRISAGVARGLEFGVGSMLLLLGCWLLWGILHDRAHALARPHGHSHAHRHTTWVGAAHGLAGTAPLVALLPVTLASSPLLVGAYLLLFGVGTTLGMAVYALVAGVVFHQAGARVPRLAGGLRAATALGSAALGVFWMYGALAAPAAA